MVTGFEPFEDYEYNASLEAVYDLPEIIGDASIIKMEVPALFGESIRFVIKKIEQESPDIVLLTGQAKDGTPISVERVAINVVDARIPDNAGRQPIDIPVRSDDMPAYFATIPIKAIVSEINKKGIESQVSNSAGTYVCNHLMYGVLSHIALNRPNVRCGFIHVPYLPSLIDQGAGKENVDQGAGKENLISREQMVEALKTAIEVTLKLKNDIVESGGKEY